MSEEKRDSFKEKIVDLAKSFKIWLLIFFVLVSFLAVNFRFADPGVAINGVVPGSASEKAGVEFNPEITLRSLEEILYMNNKKIETTDDFYNFIENFDKSSSLVIKTNKNLVGYNIDFDDSSNKTAFEELGISVRETSNSNIKLGIELEGGSRLILKTVDDITDEEFDFLVSNLQSRLDIYGASGTKVNKLEDSFSDDKFIVVESSSSNKNDIYELIKRQGKFEARIANKTVFTGDNVLKVFTDPQNARPQGCSPSDEGYICSYAFSIEIDQEGSDDFFEVSSKLDEINGRLSEEIEFIMDGQQITSLSVSSAFKYQKITNPQITVSGNPLVSEQKALESAKKEMKFLQTILSTQSLPSELEVVQSYSISSSLGQKLLENAFVVGLAALLLVSSIVAIRYRNFGIFVGIVLALVTEIIIVFGAAAFMRLTIDLAAIGGIIAAIGTGVDDQVIITDEQFRKREKRLSSRKKLKAAMYIIMISYFTTVAAMAPFGFSAALSLVKGFAFMIILGVTIGVFITRPAYAAYIRILLSNRAQRREENEEDD